MSYLLFVDESGHDRGAAPYEVLAGAAVHDTQVWPLVRSIQDAQAVFFGSTANVGIDELKAKTLLKRKVFRLAAQLGPIPQPERAELAAAVRADGAHATRAQLTALAQAKIEYCSFVLDCCLASGVRFFASIVDPSAPYPAGPMLRKDYAYLFERFFNFLNDEPAHERGLVIFDEIERTQAHILVGQMSQYFQETRTGQERSARIVPEPLFVHSDLSTLIQVADLVAYVISWNVRVGRAVAPRRMELDGLGRKVLDGRHRAIIPRAGYPGGFVVWSFDVIDDLRPRSERSWEDDFRRDLNRRLDDLESDG